MASLNSSFLLCAFLGLLVLVLAVQAEEGSLSHSEGKDKDVTGYGTMTEEKRRQRLTGGGKFAIAMEHLSKNGKDMTQSLQHYANWHKSRVQEIQRMPENIRGTATRYLQQQLETDMSLPYIQEFLKEHPELFEELLGSAADRKDEVAEEGKAEGKAHDEL